MKSIKAFIWFIILSSSFIVMSQLASPALAGCTNQYGSTVECPPNHIVVNKKVRHPSNVNLFVENLTSNDATYSPNDIIEYDIAVSNTSAVDYSEVTVTDTLPSYLTFYGGPGSYTTATKTLVYTITDLKAGTTVHNHFLTKVVDSAGFPKNTSITCDITNVVKVVGPAGQTDEDKASLCVQSNVLGATTLPVAGFDDWAFMAPFALMGLLGIAFLGKKKGIAS